MTLEDQTLQHEVEIGNVEKDLNRYWNEKMAAGEIKACLFNLVIYAHEDRRAAYLREIAHDILEHFPCRIIFIKGDKNPELDHLNISVTSEIIGKDQRKIACDEMMIDVGYQKLSRIPYLVIPHLVADLPIYLLWGQDPTADTDILPSLEKYATRLIFDSECTANLQRFAQQMMSLKKETKAAIMDVNWGHITGWRTAFAKIFDTQSMIDSLQTASTIRIVYNKKQTEYVRNHETKAIYFQGWLAARLGWNYRSMEKKGENRTISYEGSNGPITIELVPDEEPNLFAGALVSISITGKDCEFNIIRKQHHPKISVHVTTKDRCELPFTLSLPDLKKRSVFMREIFYTSINNQYTEMLNTIGPIQWETH